MLPLKPFYLIRHGQTYANQFNCIAGGGIETALTRKGREQAVELAPLMTQLNDKPVHIYTSPLFRALETAVILNRHIELPMTTLDELKEQNFGDWEGHPWKKIKDKFMKNTPPPGGETQEQFIHRMATGLSKAVHDTPDGTPLIVAHGGLFYGLANIFNKTQGIKEVGNCKLHLFEPIRHDDKPNSGTLRADNDFAWKISEFEQQNDRLIKVPAKFCMGA